MSDKDNSRMIYTLKHMPKEGRRLDGGLALRISKGNGMNVLGCSRVGVEPSLAEMEVMVTAVKEAFGTAVVFVGERPERREIPRLVGNDALLEVHYIWRIYWPVESVRPAEVVVRERPLQKMLL